MPVELIALFMWLTGQQPPAPPENPPTNPEVTLQGGGIPIQPPEKN